MNCFDGLGSADASVPSVAASAKSVGDGESGSSSIGAGAAVNDSPRSECRRNSGETGADGSGRAFAGDGDAAGRGRRCLGGDRLDGLTGGSANASAARSAVAGSKRGELGGGMLAGLGSA